MRGRNAAVACFDGKQVTEVLLSRPRPPASLVIAAMPTPFQAFCRLWWQHWDPRPRDERGLHWLAVLCSGLIHLCFIVLLLWVARVRWAYEETPSGQEGRVQLTFIGRGVLRQGGGAGQVPAASNAMGKHAKATKPIAVMAPHGQRPSAPVASLSVDQQPVAPVAAESISSPKLAPIAPPHMTIAPPHVAAPPLQATQTPMATTDFVVPPSPVPAVPRLAEPAMPVVQVRQREVQVVTERPRVLQLQPLQAQAALPVVPAPKVRERDITVPDRVSAVAPGVPASLDPAPLRAAASAPPQASEMSAAADRPGVQPADRSGGWESTQRADDWSLGERHQAGDSSSASQSRRDSLFNGDGSVRLPSQDAGRGTVVRGAPGSDHDTWTRDRIAQSGTWLKRPPYDYTPTSFDKYWVPNQSLLEEWVQRGLKEIQIPIPGTDTRITCTVSLLQFGGGCSLSSPNLNDQPASARPPPDIAFKPELQSR